MTDQERALKKRGVPVVAKLQERLFAEDGKSFCGYARNSRVERNPCQSILALSH
jgi:hypothetical protein